MTFNVGRTEHIVIYLHIDKDIHKKRLQSTKLIYHCKQDNRLRFNCLTKYYNTFKDDLWVQKLPGSVRDIFST